MGHKPHKIGSRERTRADRTASAARPGSSPRKPLGMGRARATEAMLDLAGVSLVVFDCDFRIVRVNRLFAEQSQRSAEELVGLSYLKQTISPESRALFERARRERVPVGRTAVPHRFPDQPERATMYWDWTLTPVFDKKSDLTGFVGRGVDVTDRVLAEQARRSGEERLRSLTENVPCVLMRFDRHLRICYLSPQAERYTEIANEHFVGRTNRQAGMPSELCDRWDAAIERVFRTGTPEEMHFDLAGPSGTRTFELKLAPECAPDGQVQCVLGVSSDISERTRVEEKLKEREAELRAMHAHAQSLARFPEENPDPVLRLSGSRLIYANHAARSLLGELGLGVDAFAPEVIALPAREALAEGRHRTVDIPCGGRWFGLRFVPIGTEVNVYGRDITERAQIEQALRHSEESMRRVQEIAHLGSWELDLASGQLTWSDEAYRIFGHQLREPGITYQAFLERVHPEDRADVDAAYMGSIRDGKDTYEIEHRIVRKDTGETRHVHERCQHERNSQGRIVRSRGMTLDITERKQAEQRLIDANLQLAEADRRKNEFMAVLSHELRNPLAPITNSLYILEHAPHGGEQAEKAKQIIGRQVAQLSSLVNDLLDVTRIARNKVQLQKERLDMNEIVHRAVEDNRSLFERAGVDLDLLPAHRPAHVMADRTRIAQIVGNLLQNSVKFTAKGGHTRVSVAVEEPEVLVRVADDGVGISRETLDRLFQPFMQAEQSLDRNKGGLGLGLALVKGLVELHGGSVSAHSTGLGHGTEMIVRLPLDTGVALEAAASKANAARARRRVLIIEDNADAAESLSAALGFGNHEVSIAHNGPDGIARAREFRPEVVLCDIGLPGMDGYDVARAFRVDEALRGVFLVALSGYALPKDLQCAADAGFERHLAKPPSLESLEQLLAEVPRTYSRER